MDRDIRVAAGSVWEIRDHLETTEVMSNVWVSGGDDEVSEGKGTLGGNHRGGERPWPLTAYC